MQTDMTAEMRSVFNVAYRIGVALGRKFETSDLTPELRQAARMYAASYEGDFEYLIDMRDRIISGDASFLSDRQSAGTLNCLMADAKKRLAARPTPTVATSTGRVYLSTVPDGRYRVTLADGDHLAIKIQLAGKESKLADSRIIATRIGPDEWQGFAHITPAGELRLWRSLVGTLRARITDAVNVLDDAKTEDAWLVAGLAFAQEGSQCFFCGRDLDTPESLAAGYGPTCADNHGLPWGEKVIPMSVRLAQASAAPAATEPAYTKEEEDEFMALANAPVVKHDAYAEADRANRETAARMAAVKASGRKLTYEDIFGDDD